MAHQSSAFLEARLGLWHGDLQATRRTLQQLSGRPGTIQFFRRVSLPSLAALVAAEEGRAHRACFLADSAMDALADSGQLGAVDHCDALLARARALADLGDATSAEAQAEAVQSTAAEAEHVAYMVLGAAARARVMAAGGRRADAEDQLESARQVLSRHSVRGPLGEVVDRAAAEVAVISGDRVGARRAVERLVPGRTRDLLAIRVLAMGGGLSEADVVRTVQRVRPESPREVVHARLLMAALTATSRRAEASMHLREAAAPGPRARDAAGPAGMLRGGPGARGAAGIRRCGRGHVGPRGRAAASRRTAGARCGRTERGGAPAPRAARGVPEQP